MISIDLNCDLGEGAGNDAELMPCITSANIACGRHAGDVATMAATLLLAKKHGVAIGAHPGFDDRENFGRKELNLAPAAVTDLVLEQINALQDVAGMHDAVVRHVKLHGALYHLASRDPKLAEAVSVAVGNAGEGLFFYVLAGSELERVARTHQEIRVVAEGFADRTYQRDGSLTPRGEPGAMIVDEATAIAQVLGMIHGGNVRATDGTQLPIKAETFCLHGDEPRAAEIARRLRHDLTAAGIYLQAPDA